MRLCIPNEALMLFSVARALHSSVVSDAAERCLQVCLLIELACKLGMVHAVIESVTGGNQKREG